MTSNQEIAIIDNGIKTEGIIGKAVVKQISFLNRSKMYKVPEHGTMCAQIINYIYPQARFIDLSIMESNGTTQIKKLLEALEWCIKNNIKLINLSVGTVNYFDIKSLKEVFDELQKKNVIVVAAYDNRNIKTFPAMFPGVFGVRQDREGILENQEFTFQEISKINTENTIVAHGWCNEGENHANSYAAPVITGYIANYLSKRHDAKFDEVLSHLLLCSKKEKKYKATIKNFIDRSEEVNVPIVSIKNFSNTEKSKLLYLFETKEYYSLLLDNTDEVLRVLPLKFYDPEHLHLREVLYTVNSIYGSDIILLGDEAQLYSDIEKLSDLSVEKRNDTYVIYMEEDTLLKNSMEEVFEIICNYFR